MSEEDKDFGTPERADRLRRDGQGPRNNRPESSREQRPNRYGVPRDGSRPQRDGRPAQSRGERPTYGERASRPDRADRPRYGDRPHRGDRPSYGDRPQRSDRPAYGARPDRGERPRYGDRDGAPRGDRPRYGDRDGAARGDRPQRPSRERSSFGGRPDRNDRPERGGYSRGGSQGAPRGERTGHDRGGRPSYGDRGSRPDRTERSYGDKPQRLNERSYGDRPQRSERPYGDRPQRSQDRSYGDRPERPRYGDRGGRPDRAGAPRTGGRHFGDRDERRPRFEEPELTEEQRMARELRMVRPHHDDPWIDDDVTDDMLDKAARNELKTLTKENAERVAKHLVMAVRLMDENPELAHQHVLSAARRAGRIAIVRETLGITAYAIGDFALALRELRTYRRISGSNEQIALMVDSERGVGRPDKALELGRSVDKSTLSEPTQVALAIAMSGARLDLDQVDLALAELEIPQLDPSKAFTYSPALFHAYAEVLEELGRHQEAAEWTTCAEVAERALIDAQLIASTDEDEQDIVVFEEELEEDQFDLVSEGPLDVETLALADVISSGAFEESDSAEVESTENELSIAEQDALIAEGIGPDDLLEDDVRQILMETAHLDEERK
ncbi:hypothetical protein [Aurantimicrobium minutum]|uniref:hypothetical protein n=1 Tax=Aurantimicrobium minutum TaxID=708131 RepID=UPI0024738AE2|nr:hypothetical protein [Aurantimicrobium minutum]MDH6239559.1 23S rRNA pseudouridine2605 synthase [Aurantimicrobium minutum]